MITTTTLIISIGFILAGIVLAWVLFAKKRKPAAPVTKKNAMDHLLEVKSAKGQSVVGGDSQRVSSRKGLSG